jgi:alpha-amylase/alpha-mannosidase (GH57 family)
MAPVAGFHLHFYQPPRENPWLGIATAEASAWPFHDWNERITAECYRAMIAVALPQSDGVAVELYEPLARSSVDVGPTLHHWLDRDAPDVGESLRYQVAHAPGGAAGHVLAAPLVHAILPLASVVDQERLVAWGIEDYRHRYGVAPRGMWMPETAVDLTTLGVIADQGIAYTVLMPGQAVRVRPAEGDWEPVQAETLDTSRPYFVRLADGSSLTVVFGNHDLSQRVAFGDLIDDGVALADEMADAAMSGGGVVLIVADGETYGHHHRFGDLGMAWALRRLERHHGIETSLGPWLVEQVPTWEVELAEVSAWSCAHGVERWRGDCGCVTGERPGWSLDWRAPLREALDWLREALGAVIERELAPRVTTVDAALRDYGRVIAGALDPVSFVIAHSSAPPDDDQVTTVLELCEAYRNLLYSFTSCAWFFADPGEIETSIALRYAAIAIEGVRRLLGDDLEAEFVARLTQVRSAHYEVAGEALWIRACESARFDDERVAAAAAAEFTGCGDSARRERGNFRLEFQPHEGGLIVSTIHRATLRRRSFTARVRREGPFGWRVALDRDGHQVEMTLEDFGDDVVARLACAQLLGSAEVDVEGALNLLAAQLLTRPVTVEDETVLVSLARVARYVTPIGEAAIRRALRSGEHGWVAEGDASPVASLARAVGLGATGPTTVASPSSH